MHVFGSSRKPKQKCFNVGDTEHLPEGDIQRQSGPSSSLMASRTQILSLSDCHPQSYPSWSQGGCHSSGQHPHTTSRHGKRAASSVCLFIGAKNPFPVAPRLLTPHWLELITCPCLNQKQAKGMEPHVCISGSGFTHPGWGRGGHGRGTQLLGGKLVCSASGIFLTDTFHLPYPYKLSSQ